MSDDELAHELTGLVEGTPGVVEVYPAGPVLAGLLGDRPRVAVTRSGESLRVEALVCVAGEFAVPETLRAVGDAITARLAASGTAPADATVAVRASRIH